MHSPQVGITSLNITSHRRILGIDPGTLVCGFAILDPSNKVIDIGCIRPPPKLILSERYLIIFEGIQYLLDRHQASEVAIETPFISKNAQSALKLGGAYAAVMLAAKTKSCMTFGYSPREVKQYSCGQGGAEKSLVGQAVLRQVQLQTTKKTPADALDALAIALTHTKFIHRHSLESHPKRI